MSRKPLSYAPPVPLNNSSSAKLQIKNPLLFKRKGDGFRYEFLNL
jgi:hypothetical protein